MQSDNHFFVIWNPNGGPPRHRHGDYDGALREAKRLAGLNPGQDFYVLSAVAKASTVDPVRVVTFDSIPF